MNNILFEIKGLDAKIKNMIINNIDLNDFELNPLKARVLHYIKENDTTTQKELEKVKCIPKSTLSECLSDLEKSELIIKENKNDNNKNNYIKLTTKGIKLINRLDKEFNKMNDNITKDISEYDLKVFIEVINKIKNNMERM